MQWTALLLTVLFCVRCWAEDKDLTREERAVGADVVQAVDDLIRQSCVFSDDALFLRRIAYVESRDGEDQAKAFTKNGANYYGGIWRVDEAAFEATKDLTEYFSGIEEAFDIDWSTVVWRDLWKPLYSGLAARLHLQNAVGDIPRSEDDQAEAWATQYRQGDGVVAAEFTSALSTLNTGCSVPRADILVVMDSSGSIEAHNYETMKQFVASLVDDFDISDDGVRFGMIYFANYPITQFELGKYSDKATIKTEVLETPYRAGGTKTNLALLGMRDMFSDLGRRADGVPEIAIVLTDGRSNLPNETIEAADLVHQSKITVFSIGITNRPREEELNAIGSDPDCVHVHRVQSFNDTSHFAQQLNRLACKAPADLNEGDQVDGDLDAGQAYYFKVKVYKIHNGVTITLNMRSGSLDVYFSWSVRNPSAALYQYHYVMTTNSDPDILVPYPGNEVGDEAELYATLVGGGETAGGAFTLNYVNGWYDSAAPGDPAPSCLVLVTLLAAIALVTM